jgi:hypothetical protein
MKGEDLRQYGLLPVVLDDRVAETHFDLFFYLVMHALKDLIPRQAVAIDRALYPQ